MAGIQPTLIFAESDTTLDIPSENVRPHVRESSPLPVTSPQHDGPGDCLRLSEESAFGNLPPLEEAATPATAGTAGTTRNSLPLPSPGTETSKSRPNSIDATYQEDAPGSSWAPGTPSSRQKNNSPTKSREKPCSTPFSRSLAIATCSAPERLAEKMVERLQQSCLSEANLGKTVCIWEETLPGGSRKGFSFLVAQAFAIQVKAVGFSSVEWWGGKEFKDTGGKYLVNPIPMYDKYTVKLRVRWVDEAPPRPPLNQGPSGTREGRGEGRGEGPIVAMMKEVKEVYELQKQLLLQAQAQTKVAQQELRCALRRAERAEQDTRWIAAPLGFSPRREA